MGRWHGKVGYGVREEVSPDVYKDRIVDRTYYGTVKSLTTNWQDRQNSLLDDLKVNVQISINADRYSLEHFHNIKWIEYFGAKYSVASIQPKTHRLIVTLGGLWHED